MAAVETGRAHEENEDLVDLDKELGPFRGSAIDYRLPCTGSRGHRCKIVSHLSSWNEYFCQACLELKETVGKAGELSLLSFYNPKVRCLKKEEKHVVATLLYWLFSLHHCVTFVQITVEQLQPYEAIFWKALAPKSCIFQRLQELDFAGKYFYNHVCPEKILDGLPRLVRETNSLTALKMHSLSMETADSKRFLGALAENHTLKELSVHSSVVCDPEFKEYLKHSALLQELTIVACDKAGENCLVWALQGLLLNRSLSKVCFQDAIIKQPIAELVESFLTNNQILRIFSLRLPEPKDSEREDSEYDYRVEEERLLRPLIENTVLEEVTLSTDMWREEDWVAFLGALPAKKNLNKVTITEISSTDALFLTICQHVQKHNLAGRVCFEMCYVSSGYENLGSAEFSCISASPSYYPRTPDHELFVAVVENLPTHITSLELRLPKNYLGTEVISAVTTYIENQKQLKKLTLDFSPERGSCNGYEDDDDDADEKITTIIDVLSLNKSIKDLSVCCKCMSHYNVSRLANEIMSSENIRYVHFKAESFELYKTFSEHLSEAASDGCGLFGVDLEGYVNEDCFSLWDKANQNYSDIERAFEFATNVNSDSFLPDKYCARSVQRVYENPVLLEELAEKMDIDVDAAKDVVKRCIKHCEKTMDNFMTLFGVVQHTVECRKMADQCKQLEDIKGDCWDILNDYLKLTDVADD